MDQASRFEILREHLTESGWFCDRSMWARHPLLGRYGLLSALVVNEFATAAAAMSEIGLVHSLSWDDEPRSASC
jgi:hypothetical protein